MMFSEKTEIILIIVSKKFYNSRLSTNRISAVLFGVRFSYFVYVFGSVYVKSIMSWAQ